MAWGRYQDALNRTFGGGGIGVGGRRPRPDPYPDGDGGGGGDGKEPEDPIDALLEAFATALSKYISEPGFYMEGLDGGGFGAPFANWLRSQEDFLEQLFEEQQMALTEPGGGLPTYRPEDFFREFDLETLWRMSAPPGSPGIPRMPAIVSRRMR